LPPPIDEALLAFFSKELSNQFIINDPAAIFETGSKAFLMNFKQVSAPMKICTTIDDIVDFKTQFPIVLKPFREYGGKGLVRIDGDKVWMENKQIAWKEFLSILNKEKIEYLGVKFLKNVSQGDKRIVVVNGKVMGGSLRMPAKDSWLCNVALGGTVSQTNITEEEYQIIETVNPLLSKMGIVMYGLDTSLGIMEIESFQK